MEEERTPESLRLDRSDYVASAAKSALGAVPFAGSLLAEIAGTVIPNQPIDRIVCFAVDLQKRIADIERDRLRAHPTDEISPTLSKRRCAKPRSARTTNAGPRFDLRGIGTGNASVIIGCGRSIEHGGFVLVSRRTTAICAIDTFARNRDLGSDAN